MDFKPVVKVTFNEELQADSYYFLKRLIEKIVIDELELTPTTKGMLLMESEKIME
ncbi:MULTISPECIES: hypothetical protein [Bacillaceae]|uniref:Uncharacterized protein n=1 Tax=Cytobacillus spartinae TaxID=3299023 RepID=A0ABW6KMD9_9BACI|nr:hypothetical protein [Bacillus sp. 522_BSPC]